MVTQDKRTSIPKNDGDSSRSQKLTHRVRHLLPAIDTDGGPTEPVITVLETSLYFLLGIECFDNAQAA